MRGIDMEGGIQFLQEGPSQSHCPSPPILKLIFAVVFETIEVCETGGGASGGGLVWHVRQLLGFYGKFIIFCNFFWQKYGVLEKIKPTIESVSIEA